MAGEKPIDEKAIFLAAAELAVKDRQAFLESACCADAELRRRLNALLAAHDASQGPFDVPPPGLTSCATVDLSPAEHAGTQIGPYKLLQQIGEGGMGVVYMAEQHQPVKRRVALKIVKAGMDTKHVIARFEAERQALSLMDHPHIAKALDAGATSAGRPYFVMELVKGRPITRHCDDHHLTTRQRLALFVPVCQAVQHAHQKGIIHRDLKPSNILVAEYDQRAIPKVIDFGVAKAIHQPLTEKTMFTQYGQVLGTLEYMSPEQSKMNEFDIDTRSDVYSLGVLLYELLTGTTPFDKRRLRSAAWDEMLRIIREEEPPKPSTRLSDSAETLPAISALRQTAPLKLTRMLRGDLDWIVMKALDKDRNRRYQTVNGLAADIERFLNDEPVSATPPSTIYRLRKFMRKHQRLFLTATMVGIALLLGTVIATWQALRATHSQHIAELASESQGVQKLQAEANMRLAYQALDKMYLQLVEEDLPRHPERLESYRRVLEDALTFYSTFAAKNANDMRVRYELSVALARSGKIAALLERRVAALDDLRRARSILEGLLARAPKNTRIRSTLFGTYHELGVNSGELDRFEDAFQALDEAARIVGEPLSAAPGSWQPAAFIQLQLTRGALQKRTGGFAEAERSLRQAFKVGSTLVQQTNDPRYRHLLAKVTFDLGVLTSDQGRYEAAEPFLRDAQSLLESLLAEYPDSSALRHSAATLCLNRGANLIRLDQSLDAEQVIQRGFELAEQLEREFPGNPEFSALLVDLATNLDITRGPANADPDHLLLTLERARRAAVARPDIPEYQQTLAACLNNHGVNLESSGKYNEALASYIEGLQICERLVQKAPRATLYRDLLVRVLSNLGDAYAALGRDNDAERSFRRAIDEAELLVGAAQNVLMYRILQAETANRLEVLLRKLKRVEEAVPLSRKVVEQFESIRSTDADSVTTAFHLARAHVHHGNILNDVRRYPEALEAFDRAEKAIIDATELGAATPQMADVLSVVFNNRGDVQRTLGHFAESDAAYRESIRLMKKLIQEDQSSPQHRSDLLDRLSHLAELYHRSKRLADVEPDLVEGIEVGEQLIREFPKVASFQSRLIELMNYQIAIELDCANLRAASQLSGRTLELADSVVALSPEDAKFRIMVLRATTNALAIAQRANDLPTQHRTLSRLIELDPCDANALNSLAWLLATSPDSTLRDPARAVRLALEAVAKEPENPDFQGTLGTVLYRMEDLEKAVTALDESIRLRKSDDPVSCYSYYYLAMATWRLGRHDQAHESFKRAESLASGFPDSEKDQHTTALALLRAETLGIVGPAE